MCENEWEVVVPFFEIGFFKETEIKYKLRLQKAIKRKTHFARAIFTSNDFKLVANAHTLTAQSQLLCR